MSKIPKIPVQIDRRYVLFESKKLKFLLLIRRKIYMAQNKSSQQPKKWLKGFKRFHACFLECQVMFESKKLKFLLLIRRKEQIGPKKVSSTAKKVPLGFKGFPTVWSFKDRLSGNLLKPAGNLQDLLYYKKPTKLLTTIRCVKEGQKHHKCCFLFEINHRANTFTVKASKNKGHQICYVANIWCAE